MKIQHYIESKWYSQSPGWLNILKPLEWVAHSVIARNYRQRRIALVDNTPIIVVGNITVGGTGKTPLIAAIADFLRAKGLKVAVISRGYKAQLSSDVPLKITSAHRAQDVGDEPKLLANRGLEVWICKHRLLAAEAAASSADVILSDDGLQHYQLPRSLEICVVDGQRGFGNGHLLPVGPLRETLSRLETVDFLVVTGEPTFSLSENHVFSQFVEVDGLFYVDSNSPVDRSIDECSAVAGIGNPNRFLSSIRSLGIQINESRLFIDHHEYSNDDFVGLKGPIVMTEKDAVKAVGLAHEDAIYLRVRAKINEAFFSQLFNKLESLL